jgi:sugar phosphate isomerase/epimerase
MYTLRDLAAQDMIGTLRKVKEIGYEGIELAGYGNATPADVANTVKELGLQVVGAHVGFGALQEDLGGLVAESQQMGNTHLVCPSIPGDKRTAEGYRAFAAELESIAREMQSAGMTLCYHNHDFELNDKFDGAMGLDILYQNSDPALVQAEIDTFWIQKGGADPAAYIRQYAGRAPLIHVKDMTSDERRTFAEVGAGQMAWPPIFEAAEAGGARAYIVEQDICPGDPLESIKISLQNLKAMGKLA